jgi:protein-S-isoprenylcysteine O-methyltransferase Ste14
LIPLSRGGIALKPISEFIVRLFDLIEAEGRAVRRSIERLGLGLSLTVVAAVLILLGCLLVLTGVWLGLGKEIGEAWASAITGVLMLALAGGVLWWAGRMMK